MPAKVHVQLEVLRDRSGNSGSRGEGPVGDV